MNTPKLISVGFAPKSVTDLQIAWKDLSTDEDGYFIERSTGPSGGFAQIGMTGANTQTLIDPALPADTYIYRVRAFNISGVSPYSNTVSYTLGTAPPPDPVTPPPSSWPVIPTQPNAQHLKLALVLYTYVGNNGDFPLTAAQSVSAFFSGNNFKNLYEQESYGFKLFDSVTVYGPYTLQRPSTAPAGVSLYSVDNSELSGIVARDVPPGSEVVYLYPRFSGPTDNGGGRAVEGMFSYGNGWVGEFDKLGGYSNQFQSRLFGLPFDGLGLSCIDASGVPVPLSTNCTQTLRIGDPVGPKGTFHISAIFKLRVGWLSAANQTTVTTPGTYHLAPLEVLSPGPMMLQVILPGEARYFIEYRVPVGPDSNMPSSLWNKVLVRRETAQIDMHPPSKNNQGMAVGESLHLPGGHTITLISASATGADVRIQ